MNMIIDVYFFFFFNDFTFVLISKSKENIESKWRCMQFFGVRRESIWTSAAATPISGLAVLWSKEHTEDWELAEWEEGGGVGR